jgi:alkanesulfonate monooxygenase SsuD/methylene tetrahydromethanopterin reductase-like flavin-dependent oxidoreductase (luciferase family)
MNPWCCSATWPRSPNDWSWSPGYWHCRNAGGAGGQTSRRGRRAVRGRLRLGVGLGWVEPEFRALNETFTDRGRRIQEQLAVLRALFTQEVVTFSGRWHDLDAVGIAPLPTRPIPIWIGDQADAALRRVAALGDGWMPMIGPQQAQRDGFISRLRT